MSTSVPEADTQLISITQQFSEPQQKVEPALREHAPVPVYSLWHYSLSVNLPASFVLFFEDEDYQENKFHKNLNVLI